MNQIKKKNKEKYILKILKRREIKNSSFLKGKILKKALQSNICI
jgi:hypothetical protein